jgi:hypothetical protein
MIAAIVIFTAQVHMIAMLATWVGENKRCGGVSFNVLLEIGHNLLY